MRAKIMVGIKNPCGTSTSAMRSEILRSLIHVQNRNAHAAMVAARSLELFRHESGEGLLDSGIAALIRPVPDGRWRRWSARAFVGDRSVRLPCATA